MRVLFSPTKGLSVFSVLVPLAVLAVLSEFFDVQAALAQAPPTSEAAPSKALIDPKAREVLERTLAKYRDLKTLSEVIDFRVVGGGQGGGLQSYTATLNLDRAGGRARVARVHTGGTWTAVSDGSTLYVLRSSEPTRYVKRSVEERGRSLFYVFHEIDATGPGLGILLGEMDCDQLVKQGMKSLTLGDPQMINGVPAQTLKANCVFDKNTRGVVTFVIFKNDGLLRRIDYDITIQGSTATKPVYMRITEDHTKTVINRPLAEDIFTVKLPPDAMAVSKFD